MALVLTCAKCAQRLSIPDEMRGKQVRCPKCKEVYTVDRKSMKPSSSSTAAHNRPSRSVQLGTRPAAASQNAARPRTTHCPKCSLQLRLPSQAGTSTFQCPQCSTKLTVPEPPGSAPVVNKGSAGHPATAQARVSPRQATSATDDSIFGNLPTSPVASHRRPAAAAGPLGQNPYGALPSRGLPAAGGPGTSRFGSSGLLWQGLLIAIPNALALLFVGLAIVLNLRADPTKAGASTVISVMFGVIAVNLVVVIAGAIGMIIGVPRWLNITTCVVAIVPAILMCGPCVGFFLYPFALGGAVWGLIQLFAISPTPAIAMGGRYMQSSPAPATNYRPASGHLQQAEQEAKQHKSSGDETGSMLVTVMYLLGGIVFLGLSIASVVLLCLVLMGKAEAQRPFKAVASAIFCGSTGFGLLAKGIARFQNRR